MSLQVWLPFTTDNENKGLDNSYYNGGAFISERYGKSSNGTVKGTSSTLTSDSGFSFSIWWKISDGDSYNMSIPIHTGIANNVVLTFNRMDYTTHYAIKLAATNNEPQMIWIRDTRDSSGVWALGEWNHFTITVQNTNEKMYVRAYVNGNLVTTYTSTTYSLTLRPGDISIGGSALRNDFRLYNHCLSQTEVERDYATLLLHFPLRDSAIENTVNLLPYPTPKGNVSAGWDASLHPGAINVSNWSVGYNSGVGSPAIGYHAHWVLIDNIPTMKFPDLNSELVSTHRWLGISSNTSINLTALIQPSGTYTVSYEARADVEGKKIHSGIYYQLTTGTSKGFQDGTKEDILTTKWKKYSYTKTMSANANTSIAGQFYMYGHTSGPEGVAYVRNLQIELKNHATDYTENTRVDMPIYDCSGRNHDSVARGNLIVIKDSLRNQNCIQFTSNNSIKFLNPFETSAISECSIAFWVYLDSTNNYMCIFSSNYGTPTSNQAGWFSLNCEGYPMWFYSNPNYWRASAGGAFITNKWYHVVMTFKNGTVKFYCNGKPYGNAVTITTAPSFHGATYFTLGDSYTGTSWSGAPFNGRIGDFRIYGIALTETMIKDLYTNSATIDKSGNIHAFELVED